MTKSPSVRRLAFDQLRPMMVRLAKAGLATICQEAKCPNRAECFSSGTATFLVLGKRCTRSCRYCSVATGKPAPPDPTEPERLAAAAEELGLKHVVITSVTRDDLPDGGALHLAECVRRVLMRLPHATVELLIPDFGGNLRALQAVLETPISVLNHNVETVPRLFPSIRPQGNYQVSLELIRQAASARSDLLIKSGLMVGLGESFDEVVKVLEDLASVGCHVVTVGQYIRPTERQVEIARWWSRAEFDELTRIGRSMGIEVLAGRYVRSSYMAAALLNRFRNAR